MSKKKHGPGGSKQPPTAAQKHPNPQPPKSSKAGFILATVALVFLGGILIANLTSKGTGDSPKSSGTVPQAPADEQKYIGRLLPADHQEPVVAAAAKYTTTVKMTTLTAAQEETQIVVPVADVVADKIVYFEYQKSADEVIPLLAYVKPSGKLFVGVSYCPPCEGEGQRLEADGTLTCESCGTKRDLESGVGLSGACKLYPIDELATTVAGGNIVLDKSALDGWTAQPLDRKVGE